MDLDFNAGIDFELDFDLDDFNVLEDGMGLGLGETAQPQEHIIKPRIKKESVTRKAAYANAEKFAEQVDLSPDVNTFAWVSGTFIFGDILEALMIKRHVSPKELYICSLSLSRENIDSFHNILKFGQVEKFVLVLSGFFYSHEKFGLIPYLYEQLDDPRVQISFGNFHCKIIALKTHFGNCMTIHGSANLRSSNSIEQIMISQEPELYKFNADIMQSIADELGTFNHNATYHNTAERNERTWQAVASRQPEKGGEEDGTCRRKH